MANLIERHKGTDYVEKTGPAILQRGEAVISAKDNKKRLKMKHKRNSMDDLVAQGAKH